MITDEHNGYSETMATKHYNEQKRIDEMIDSQFKPAVYKENAEVGLNYFFDITE